MNRVMLIAGMLYAGLASAGEPEGVRIDTEQWRAQPVKHLFIHGTLTGGTGFHLLLPETGSWQGRLLHFLGGGMGGVDDGGVGGVPAAYALTNGAIYVESSQGYKGPSYTGDFTQEDVSYKASHAVVLYARARSLKMYGKEPAHSYVFGSSGGGFRSSGMLERFPELYDGAVPAMGAGSLDFGFQIHSLRDDVSPAILPHLAAIDDVYRTGGSGRLADALDHSEQSAAMKALMDGGFPRHSILFIQPNPGGMSLREFLFYKGDPAWFDEFRKHCGKCPGLVEGIKGSVRNQVGPGKRLMTDLNRPNNELVGYTLIFSDGAQKGRAYTVTGNNGPSLVLSMFGPGLDGVNLGDRFTLDNADLLAWHAYHAQVRPKGTGPAEPDRPLGRIQGKLIAVFGADDFNVWPSVGVRYHQAVLRELGARTGDHFRIHFIEHGQHSKVDPSALDRQVADGHVVYKALDDLMAWVERGVPAPSGTTYTLDADNQLVFPQSAGARGGYQPVVELYADGRTGRLEIAPGAEVRFHVEAEDPDNDVIRAEMDFEGDNRFDETRPVRGKKVTADFSHRYDQPGVYFATVRVTDSTAIHGARVGGIQNLASVRVIISRPAADGRSN
jgi:hypothetical protein